MLGDAAFRDVTMLKVAYAYGLRRNENRMLDSADFGRNHSGEEFDDYGVVYVRYGKAQRDSLRSESARSLSGRG